MFLSKTSHLITTSALFSIHPSIHRARFHCGLWNCIMTGSRAPLPTRAAAMHRVHYYSFTLHARSRSAPNTIICTFQQRGRVNIYYKAVLRLLTISNNQRNNLRQDLRSFRFKKNSRLRYINTAGTRAKYPASKNNTRVEKRQYSRV